MSSPKPGHTTGGSGRSARRGGRAGSGRVECQQNCSLMKNGSVAPPKASNKRRLNVSPEARISETLCKPNLSSPKPGHTTGGSGRGARRGGGAGSGRTGCQQNCSPWGHASVVSSKASKTRRLNVSPEARTSEILCKPMGKQNPRLTRGSSPVDPRFISGTRSALSSWLLTNGPALFCLCKPFSCKACPGKTILAQT